MSLRDERDPPDLSSIVELEGFDVCLNYLTQNGQNNVLPYTSVICSVTYQSGISQDRGAQKTRHCPPKDPGLQQVADANTKFLLEIAP